MANSMKPIQRDDLSVKDPFEFINESAKKTLAQVNLLKADLQAMLPLTEKIFKGKASTVAELNAQEKALQKLIATKERAKKLEDEVTRGLITHEKIEQARIRTENLREARQKRNNTQTEREIKANARLESGYFKIQDKLTRTANEYRELAIRKELLNDLTSKEELRYATLQKRLLTYDGVLKKVDAQMGRHQRSVGQYGNAFNSLSFSMAQITREAPAFANSISTGFMAISNNIPMFIDEINKIKIANKALAKEGLATKSVLRQVGAAIFSWQTLLSVGVTLLTIYGEKIVKWAEKLIFGAKAVDKLAESKKILAKIEKEQIKNISEESKEFAVLIGRLMSTNKGSSERIELIKEINKQYGTTLQNIQDETKFQAQLNLELAQYMKFKEIQFKIQKNEAFTIDILNNKQKAELDYRRKKKLFEDAEKKFSASDSNLATPEYIQESFALLKLQTEYENAAKKVDEFSDSYKKVTKRIQDLSKAALEFEYIDPNGKKTRAVRDPKDEKYNAIDAEYARRRKNILESLDPIRKEESDLFDLETWRYEQKIALEEKLQGKERSQEIIDTLKGDLIIHERTLEVKREYVNLLNEELDKLFEIKDEVKDFPKLFEALAKSIQDGLLDLREMARTTKEIAVVQAELDLLDAKKGGNKRAIIKAEKELVKAKIEEIKARLEADKLKATSNEEISLLEKKAELAIKQLETGKKEIDQQKELAKIAKEVNQIISDYLREVLENQIKALDDQIARVNKSYTLLEEKAAKGNLLAQESIKEQMRLEQELIDIRTKKAQQLALVGAISGFAGNVFGGGGGLSLGALFGSIAGFETGTEGTVGEALKPNLKGVGKDDTLIRVHGKERILNEQLSSKIQGHRTSEVVNGFLEYEKLKTNSNNEYLSNSQPQQIHYGLEEIIPKVFEVIKTETQGNATRVTRRKIDRR